MTAGPPDLPPAADDDGLASDLLASRKQRRRLLQDSLLGGEDVYAAPEAEAPPEAEPAAGPTVAECFADLDVSALVEEHLQARTRRARPANPRVAAMRAMRGAERLAREADPEAAARPTAAGGDLAERLAASLAAAGEAPRLEAAQASLASGEVARKITGLAASVRQLVPVEVDLGALAQEAGKQAVMNTLNPAVAASLAAADTARRINALRGWGGMPPRERVAHVAALGANMADLIGAFTPPPTGAAAQALGAGLGLVALASDAQVGRRRLPRPEEAEAAVVPPMRPDPETEGAAFGRKEGGPPAQPPGRTPIPPRVTGPLSPRSRTGELPPPPAARAKTGDLKPPGPPRAVAADGAGGTPGRGPIPPPRPGTGMLQERRDNLAHNLGDRAQGAWARLTKRLDEVKPLLDHLKPASSDDPPPAP